MQPDAGYEQGTGPIPPDPVRRRKRRFLIGAVILLLLIVGAVFAAYELIASPFQAMLQFAAEALITPAGAASGGRVGAGRVLGWSMHHASR